MTVCHWKDEWSRWQFYGYLVSANFANTSHSVLNSLIRKKNQWDKVRRTVQKKMREMPTHFSAFQLCERERTNFIIINFIMEAAEEDDY